jgi:hypothetical protein
MKIITVATESNGYFYSLQESATKFNYELIVLGYGEKWKGFGWRVNLIIDYIKTLPKNEIILMVDAYDVIILRDSNELKEEFIKLNVKFLCGAFRKLDGLLGLCQEIEFGKTKNNIPPPYNNLCAGTWISTVEYAISIYDNLYIENNKDDQVLLNQIYDNDNNLITPDYNFNIFCTVFPTLLTRQIRSDDQILITNKKLYCGVTKTYPFIIHGVGNTDLTNILNKLDFNNTNNYTPSIYISKKMFYHLKLIIVTFFKLFFN